MYIILLQNITDQFDNDDELPLSELRDMIRSVTVEDRLIETSELLQQSETTEPFYRVSVIRAAFGGDIVISEMEEDIPNASTETEDLHVKTLLLDHPLHINLSEFIDANSTGNQSLLLI